MRSAAQFPELALIRLDADTVAKPGAAADALSRFAASDRVVLVGTQMVKGHHFGGVALAAVVDADTGLGLPDFRAEERTFQLLTQLAGRSGRDAPGRVLIQTFVMRGRSGTRRGTTSRDSSQKPRAAGSSVIRRSATSFAS